MRLDQMPSKTAARMPGKIALRIFFVPDLPLNAAGKVDRKRLAERLVGEMNTPSPPERTG